MKMNNKGFTLVELLAVLAIIAIIGMIAIPNVISVVDNNKKDLMLQDAQKLVSLAKAVVIKDREFRDGTATETPRLTLNTLDDKKTIVTDPDGGAYERNNSYVIYRKSVGYCVYLEGSKRIIRAGQNNNGCVEEEKLTSRSYVFDK